MPKRKTHQPPPTNDTGKRQAPNRLAQLLAEAISKDEDVLQEIQTLIAKKPDGTNTSEPFSDTDSAVSAGPSITPDAIFPTTTENEGLVDLGLFSLIHPPVDAKIRTQICNKEYVDIAKLIFTE